MILLNKFTIGILVALLVLGGYVTRNKWLAADTVSAISTTPEHKSSDTLHFEPNAPQLTFVQIKAVESFPESVVEPLNGRVVYNDNRTAKVFTPIAGRVLKIFAETGSSVKKGDNLLAIDAPDFALAAADYRKAEVDLVHKKEVLDRAEALYTAKGIAFKELEAARADWVQSQAEATRAKARLENLTRHTGEAGSPYLLAAPIDGVISERQVNAGSEVRPDAANPLFVITDQRQVWVQVDLPEQQLGKVHIGQSVMVNVDAFPNEIFMGKVTVIGGAMDTFTRRVQFRCELNNPELKLKAEMYAKVTPIADVRQRLPRIPNTALFTQGLYSYVFVELSPGVLQRRRVTLGLQGHETYIKSGLKVGEHVVTSGALLLNAELASND